MNNYLHFLTNKVEQLIFYLKYPSLYKYFLSFFRMRFITNDVPVLLFKEPYLPWYTYDAILWVKKYIKTHKKVFEYGSGNSTLFYVYNKVNIYAVEHNKEWYKQFKKMVIKNKFNPKVIKNIYLKKPIVNKNKLNINKELDYSSYVSTLNKFPDGYFDLIIIDGRARNDCINLALRKIKKGGYIMFDNSELKQYSYAMIQLSKYKRTDFPGRGPYINTIWQTSIWKIE